MTTASYKDMLAVQKRVRKAANAVERLRGEMAVAQAELEAALTAQDALLGGLRAPTKAGEQT